ncbi:M20 family metallo-hydrolase [Oceanisphaera sp.]|uniref:M20 family metallo-hydrolase n=1 Tax=Oceanisphaera sp. TaxID=1929979 RepID=UPI003A94378D
MDTAPLIDSDRLWKSLMTMATIGPTPNGGSRRLALTAEDFAGRAQLIEWCQAIGCTTRVDEIGNLFIRRPGLNNELAPIGTGSHLDTQPLGGRFDGILGVLAGLEVFRTLDAHRITTQRPLELVVWTNEEGSRFAPAMMGSAVYAGLLPLSEALSSTDREGISVSEALSVAQIAEMECGESKPFHAFFELHIEQGPVLEKEMIDIGIVTGAQGIRWYDIRLQGQAAHAGPTPMAYRRDALFAVSAFIEQLKAVVKSDETGRAKFTIGELVIAEPSRNVVPGDITMSIDLRHECEAGLDALEQAMLNALQLGAEREGVTVDWTRRWKSPVRTFNSHCIELVAQATEVLGYSAKPMMSGAGHDTVNLSDVTPCAMIFIPCRDGISHNESEFATPEQCAKGTQVLLHTMLEAANSVESN